MNKIILKIDGMSCSACSNGLEKYLNKQNGIKNATVNLVLAQANIEYDDSLTIDDLNRFVSEAGFESLGIYDLKKETSKKDNNYLLIIFTILSIFTMYVSMSHMIGLKVIKHLHMINYPINYSVCLFILSIIFLIYGFDILKSGIKNIIHKLPNMDSLVTIGVLSSFIYSFINMIKVIIGKNQYVELLYFESVCLVIYFIKLGRYIDKKSKEKTKEALKELVQITPETALLKVKDGEKEVTIDEVKKNDILICKPGMKIAVDGIITSGSTHTDESFITGESNPVKKSINDNVVAGSINYDGYIEYKAINIGKNSTISQMVKLVIEATNTKPKIQLLADKVSSFFVPSVIIIALLTLIISLLFGKSLNESLISFVNVLVVSCPCALGLATPIAIVVSEGVCAKNGILVKSSQILERACKINTIVFDKTGTITYGKLKVSKIFNYSKYKDSELLSIISSLESKTNHPISSAFKDYKKVEVTNFKALEGIGIYGTINKNNYHIGNNKLFKILKIDNNYIEDENNLREDGNSIVYIIENKKVIALIGVKDIIRNNVKNTISNLKKDNIDVIMLTGDNYNTASNIAKKINIDNVISDVMPNEKTNKIKELLNDNKLVMMVGDGINDAPALVSSSIGVSMNTATDIASDSSDVILMHDDINSVYDLICISKKTIRIIKQNLFWAFFYNILMIPIAMGLFKPYGISLNPMYASIAMMISSLTVVLNALRLGDFKNK